MNVTNVTFIKRVATRKRDEVRWREPNPAAPINPQPGKTQLVSYCDKQDLKGAFAMDVTNVTSIKRVATRKRDEVRWREPNPEVKAFKAERNAEAVGLRRPPRSEQWARVN